MKHTNSKTLPLTIGAIGIVYGDLGTSPLYALRESLKGLTINPENILGVLSLVFWVLIILISIKYLCFVLRADNDGEGGILALIALIKKNNTQAFKTLLIFGIFGTALLIGDGMMTPAISVISAVEGLAVIAPAFSNHSVAITVCIILVLYLFQYLGTGKIGSLFGPIIITWFLTIGVLGLVHLNDSPLIYKALNPYYGYLFFLNHGFTGYILLGGIFLAVTGAEALYADLGQFGIKPIRIGWFALALPCLLLNYFGQGALILKNPTAIENPFYSLAPEWFSFPLLIIATSAAIIASQAVISATFSIMKQAILLDLYPKVPIVQTSSEERGQVYIPHMNYILALGTTLIVLTFKTSSAMAYAYGIAVNLDMITVSILMLYVAHKIWKWSLFKAILLFSLFLFVELAFLGSNLHKILSGGWVPILFALLCMSIMLTWHQGIQYLSKSFYKNTDELRNEVAQLNKSELNALPESTAIFIREPYTKSTSKLLEYFKLNHMLPHRVLIVTVNIANVPYVNIQDRYAIEKLTSNIYSLTLTVGFMQLISIPMTLAIAKKRKILPFKINLKTATYIIEITQISATERKPTLRFFWQEKLFAFLMRNATVDIEFYNLPYDRTIAIGNYVEF